MEYCNGEDGCDGSGILYYIHGRKTIVERCDLCAKFPSDIDAALSLEKNFKVKGNKAEFEDRCSFIFKTEDLDD